MSKKQRGAPNLHGYARWSGITFQMAVIVALGYFIGSKLDKASAKLEPWGKLIGVVVGVIVAMAVIIRQITTNKKSE